MGQLKDDFGDINSISIINAGGLQNLVMVCGTLKVGSKSKWNYEMKV
jgi:hypothetical protein